MKLDLKKLKKEIEQYYGYEVIKRSSGHISVLSHEKRIDLYSKGRYHKVDTNKRGNINEPFELIESYLGSTL